jgi:hypothetical protein
MRECLNITCGFDTTYAGLWLTRPPVPVSIEILAESERCFGSSEGPLVPAVASPLEWSDGKLRKMKTANNAK